MIEAISSPDARQLHNSATDGACYCYCLEMKDNFNPNGVSTGMDVQWYGPAPKYVFTIADCSHYRHAETSEVLLSR